MASSTLMESLRLLTENEMYEDMKQLLGPLCTIGENNDRLVSSAERLSLLVQLAVANRKTGELQLAIANLQQALRLRRCVSRLRNLPTEVEIRWQLYKCYTALAMKAEAKAELLSIPEKARTPQMLLAQGHHHLLEGEERKAQAAYRSCLKRTRGLSLEAARGLLAAKTPLSDVLPLLQALQQQQQQHQEQLQQQQQALVLRTLNQYVEACVQAAGQSYQPSLDTLRRLSQSGQPLHSDPNVAAALAEALYQSGEYRLAMEHFARIRGANSHWLRHMDSFAHLLQRANCLLPAASGDKQRLLLDRLATDALHASQHRAEPWIINGYLAHSQQRTKTNASNTNSNASNSNSNNNRALSFAHKALQLQPNSVHALLLSGCACAKAGREKEALNFLVEARRLAPSNFEIQHAIVCAYIDRRKYRTAVAKAELVLQQLGKSSRTLSLLGIANSFENKDTAIEQLSYCVSQFGLAACQCDSIVVLAELFIERKRYAEARQLLAQRLQLEKPSEASAELHRLLGDCALRLNEREEALLQYERASQQDPNNRRAKEAANAVRHAAAAADAAAAGAAAADASGGAGDHSFDASD